MDNEDRWARMVRGGVEIALAEGEFEGGGREGEEDVIATLDVTDIKARPSGCARRASTSASCSRSPARSGCWTSSTPTGTASSSPKTYDTVRTMRAVRLHDTGLAVEEIEVPTVQEGEALIRVHAAAITRDELTWPLDRLPAIPSYELSGVVAQVAADVDDIEVGEEVFALTAFDRDGVAAEYAVVPAVVLAPRPTSLTHVESAALPMPGLSAWQGIFEYGALKEGERVSVLGANGGVGHVAVQLVRGQFAADDDTRDLAFDTVGGDELTSAVGMGGQSRLDRGGSRRRDVLRRRAKSRAARRARTTSRRWRADPGSRLGLPPRGSRRGLRPCRRAWQAGQGRASCRRRLSRRPKHSARCMPATRS